MSVLAPLTFDFGRSCLLEPRIKISTQFVWPFWYVTIKQIPAFTSEELFCARYDAFSVYNNVSRSL